MSEGSSFSDTNQAPYGDNIASIPYGVRVLSYNNDEDVVSGNSFEILLKVEIIDYLGNRITNDNSSYEINYLQFLLVLL